MLKNWMDQTEKNRGRVEKLQNQSVRRSKRDL